MKLNKLLLIFWVALSLLVFLIFSINGLSGTFILIFSSHQFQLLLFLFSLLALLPLTFMSMGRKSSSRKEEEYQPRVVSVRRYQHEEEPSVRVVSHRKSLQYQNPLHLYSTQATEKAPYTFSSSDREYGIGKTSSYTSTKNESKYSPVVVGVKKREAELPPGVIYIRIEDNAIRYLREVGGLERVVELLEKYLDVSKYKILIQMVKEKDAPFRLTDFGYIPCSSNSITITITGRNFSEEIDNEIKSYKPLGVTIGTKIVISMRRLVERFNELEKMYGKGSIYNSHLLENLFLHELGHALGLRDKPGSKTIMDPIHLPFYLPEEDVKEIKRRIKEFLRSSEK